MSSTNSQGLTLQELLMNSPNKLEQQLLRQNSLKQAETQNNTSSGFELPSEFKLKWENLVKDQILDAFGDFFDQVNILIGLAQFSFRSVQKIIKEALQEKLNNVIKLFNLQTDHKTQDELEIMLKPLLKNNYKDIFKDQTLIDKFLNQFILEIKGGYFDEDQIDQILEMLDDNKSAISSYLNHVKNIILYMQINEPQIILNEPKLPNKSTDIDQIQLHKYYSEYFSIIDGFEKEGSPCIVILNQPKIGNGSFAGIKPSVIILTEIPQGFNTELIDLREQMLNSTSFDNSKTYEFSRLLQSSYKLDSTNSSMMKQQKENQQIGQESLLLTPQYSINQKNKNVKLAATQQQEEIEEKSPMQIIRQFSHTPQITFNLFQSNQEQSVDDINQQREIQRRSSFNEKLSNIKNESKYVRKYEEGDVESSDNNCNSDDDSLQRQDDHQNKNIMSSFVNQNILKDLNSDNIIQDPQDLSKTSNFELRYKLFNNDGSPCIKQINSPEANAKQTLSRNDSQHNDFSYQNQNKSMENFYLEAQEQMKQSSKSSSKKINNVKKYHNQILYENLTQLEKNFNGSRFLQCSLNFTKFLRNMNSKSPQRDIQSELNISQNRQYHQQQKMISMKRQTEQKQQILKTEPRPKELSPNKSINAKQQQQQQTSTLKKQKNHSIAKISMFKLRNQKEYEYIDNSSTSNFDSVRINQDKSQITTVSGAPQVSSGKIANKNITLRKRKTEIQSTIEKNLPKDQLNQLLPRSTLNSSSMNNTRKNFKESNQGKSKSKVTTTRTTNQVLETQNDKNHNLSHHKVSPFQERILKQGQVLKRKPSYNPFGQHKDLSKLALTSIDNNRITNRVNNHQYQDNHSSIKKNKDSHNNSSNNTSTTLQTIQIEQRPGVNNLNTQQSSQQFKPIRSPKGSVNFSSSLKQNAKR